jgi:hypothetical protein
LAVALILSARPASYNNDRSMRIVPVWTVSKSFNRAPEEFAGKDLDTDVTAGSANSGGER